MVTSGRRTPEEVDALVRTNVSAVRSALYGGRTLVGDALRRAIHHPVTIGEAQTRWQVTPEEWAAYQAWKRCRSDADRRWRRLREWSDPFSAPHRS